MNNYTYEINFGKKMSKEIMKKIAENLLDLAGNCMEAICEAEVSWNDHLICFEADIDASMVKIQPGEKASWNDNFGGCPECDAQIEYGYNTKEAFTECVKQAFTMAGYSYDTIMEEYDGEEISYNFPSKNDIFTCRAEYDKAIIETSASVC